ncbi:hypothetical protein PR003_g23797 [Phytophthora rubi]|uniref:Uncharacterized protein n=1 Tax=Phytophthora rubi TaxID=129364 RepID=A0A6A4CYY3_9STRA|nr:hypothetical protein PR003_g23797 [Phytophthora rubi]
MSPTRAGQSQSPAPGVDDTAQAISTNEDQAGPLLDENATAANDGDTRPSFSAPPSEFRGNSSVSNPSPPQTSRDDQADWQPPPSQGDGLRVLRLLLTPRSQGDDPRDLPPLVNMNPGGRYDDKELAENTKALVSSPPIKLPKLHSKSDYKSWRSEVPLHFDTRMLDAITYGTERYDESEGLRRAKYYELFSARKNNAFSAVALSLSVDLRTTFKIDDIRDNIDAAALLLRSTLRSATASILTDYLLQELVTRRLKSGETVTAYVDDVARKVTLLHQANKEFTEWQHASLLLSNCVEVYQGLTREHGDWINNHDRQSLTLAEAVQRLRAVEHQREQLCGQTGSS